MSFQVNDKVVCVDDSPTRLAHGFIARNWTEASRPNLVKGRIYCVTEIGVSMAGVAVVQLAGFDLGFTTCGVEILPRASRFRLVSEVQAENRAMRKHIRRIVRKETRP